MRVKKPYRKITGTDEKAKNRDETLFTEIICHAQDVILNLCLSEVNQ